MIYNSETGSAAHGLECCVRMGSGFTWQMEQWVNPLSFHKRLYCHAENQVVPRKLRPLMKGGVFIIF